MADDLGLRERKKRETRTALRRAAFELCAERGLDAVPVIDIAERANVSPRTFFNYFSSKEEAVVGGTEPAQRIVELLTERSDDEPLWDALRAGIAGLLAEEPSLQRDLVALARLVSENPSLARQQMASWIEMEPVLVVEVARRAGTDPAELFPRLVVASVGAAVRVALDHWLGSPGDLPLTRVVDDALAMFAVGLEPSGHPTHVGAPPPLPHP